MDEIWQIKPELSALARVSENTLSEHLGIEFTEIGPDYIKATMPVDRRTIQPAGLLHGGASVALAETLGSLAANLCIDPTRQTCVGLEVNANHVRAARGGLVEGTARPLHIGGRTQVWEIRICEAGSGRLVCISRLTIAVLDR